MHRRGNDHGSGGHTAVQARTHHRLVDYQPVAAGDPQFAVAQVASLRRPQPSCRLPGQRMQRTVSKPTPSGAWLLVTSPSSIGRTATARFAARCWPGCSRHACPRSAWPRSAGGHLGIAGVVRRRRRACHPRRAGAGWPASTASWMNAASWSSRPASLWRMTLPRAWHWSGWMGRACLPTLRARRCCSLRPTGCGRLRAAWRRSRSAPCTATSTNGARP